MRQAFAKFFGRVKDDESGSASVEFVLVVPIYITLLMMSVELGFITLKHTLMERGLDMAVRQIRLGTGDPGTHAEIKQVICENAGFLYNCEANLRLEMKPVDLRTYSSLGEGALCTDRAEPVDPATLDDDFQFGVPNELMVLRACFKYDPFFPDALLGQTLTRDSSGQAAIITMAAFVQEPL